MSFLNFFKQRMGFQPITNKIAKDRLAMMVKQQRMCVHNDKLLFDVTTVVAQYLKIQADKNPYISCMSYPLLSPPFCFLTLTPPDDNDEVILHFPVVMERSRA
jgi:septum formation topological specificity factor MinE